MVLFILDTTPHTKSMCDHTYGMITHTYGTGCSHIQQTGFTFLERFDGKKKYDHRQFSVGEQCE